MSDASESRKRKLVRLLASGTRHQPSSQATTDSSGLHGRALQCLELAEIRHSLNPQAPATGFSLDDDWDDGALSDTLIAVKVAISAFPRSAATAQCIPLALMTIVQASSTTPRKGSAPAWGNRPAC
jgi:hypothetical protein